MCLALMGCGTSMPTFTSAYRASLATDDLSALRFYPSADMEFRSTQKGVIEGEGVFKVEKRKTYKIERERAGRAVKSGEGWVTVDFEEGVLITFRQSDQNGKYVCPAWGTYTFNGERFDAVMGVLAGGYVELLYAPPPIVESENKQP
jgi:hypothetical protein